MSAAEPRSRTRIGIRGRELVLLGGATLVATAAAALLQLSQGPDIAFEHVLPVLTIGAVGLLAHLVIRGRCPDADPLLLPLAVLLNGLGLVFVRRVDLATGGELATPQTLWSVVSMLAMCGLLLGLREVRRFERYQYTFGLATLALLLLPLVPGLTAGQINGAQLWVRVAGMTIQPGELAKVTMVLFLAGYLERNRALLSVATQRIGPLLMPAARSLAPVFLAAGAALVIMAGLRDLGSALLIFGAFITLLYVATGRVAYPVVGAVAFAGAAFLAHSLFPHVRTRVSIWIDPWSQVQDAGYQLAQSLFAFGTGGLTGTGPGFGRPQDIPFSSTDAIFSVIGEELGLLGTTAILMVFLLIAVRGFKIAMTAKDEFSTLLAVGLTVTLAFQTFVIVGGVTRLVPLTGITLPFVSYGGSSLLSNYLIIGLLLAISDESRAQATGRQRRRKAEREVAA